MLFFFVVFNFFRAPPFARFFRDGHTMQKPEQGTLMAFWGQPKKRAPDVDPEAPTPAKRTALTPAPAAASVGSPLLQAHCASRQ